MKRIDNQQGVSIVAAIFIIVILAFMGVMLVSILGGGTSASINEMQSARALYIAEGGLEFALMNGAFCTYNYPMPGVTLGTGFFVVSSQQNNATTTNAALDGVTNPINVPLTAAPAGFLIPGAIMIDTEYLFCTGADMVGNRFTGCIRGWAAPPGAAAHGPNAAVSQCVITSTGTVPTGFLVGNVTRTVQATVGP